LAGCFGLLYAYRGGDANMQSVVSVGNLSRQFARRLVF
jgi:hypothetical protein